MSTDTTAVEDGSVAKTTAASSGHRHLGWALVLISVAQLMVVLDSTIANIALPHIQSDLGLSDSSKSWIVTGYALAFGGLLLLGGRLGDLYGHRRLFAIGVTVFAIASLFGGLAQNEAMLILGRATQGFGAAIASPAALALITTTFPAGPERNRAFSIYAAMSGAGAAVGLILGGWLTGLRPHLFGHTFEGWRLTFLIVVPFGLGAAAVSKWVLADGERRTGGLDLPGAVTATFGLLAVVFGLTRAGQPNHGWGDSGTIVSLVVGIALLAAFITIERRVENPLMPFRILADRTRGTSYAVMFIVPAAMFAMFYFLATYVQTVMGFSPLKAGFAFLPFSFGIVIAATIASKLMSHVDPRWIAGTGLGMAAVAMFGMSRLPFDNKLPNIGSHAHYATNLLPYIVLMALGMGLVFVPATLTAVHGVDHEDSGIGSAVLNAMQQVGGALGLSILSTVAVTATTNKAKELAAAAAQLGPNSGLPADPQKAGHLIGLMSFSTGAVVAFLVGALMILAAAVIAIVFQDVKHEELAADGADVGAMMH
jgi:EmrB/QacA subfamily drug resistance transporter